MMNRAFAPKNGGTVSINVSGSSQAVLVSKQNAPMSVRVHNAGSAMVWIRAGGSTVTASSATDLPVGPGLYEILTFSPDANGELYIAAIAAGATGLIYFTQGEGL